MDAKQFVRDDSHIRRLVRKIAVPLKSEFRKVFALTYTKGYAAGIEGTLEGPRQKQTPKKRGKNV